MFEDDEILFELEVFPCPVGSPEPKPYDPTEPPPIHPLPLLDDGISLI